jgi:hypothetical protein
MSRRTPTHRRSSGFAFWFPRRWPLKTLLVPPLAVVILASTSIVGALQSPGNQNFSAKWADWLRSHHETALSKEVEQIYYDAHKPKAGGSVVALNHVPTPPTAATATTLAKSHAAVTVATHLPAPPDVPLVVHPAVSGEGKWAPAGPLVKGVPAMYVAQFRADQVYTGQITTAVWMDPTLLDVNLVPGSQEPGGTWTVPPYITPLELPNVVAAFNGGFRFHDAHGGFYLDGRTAVPLVTGAASVVIYANGNVNVGAWGTEVTMTPQVTAVLQNLVPIVDNGQPAPAATYNDSKIWGATLGQHTVVARSGLGVTATGALVYVAGPALTARSLAESLQRAGAVRAMALDINPEWVTFNFFTHDDPSTPSDVSPSKLYPTMERPADRYLGPTHESRDFFSVSIP